MRVVVFLGCAACATTTSVCPLGTKRVDVRTADHRAQWCATEDPRPTALPMPGRSYAGALGSQPPAMTGGVNGPFTSWHPNGNLASHGHYLDFSARSVPDGLWSFWFPSGVCHTLGMYHRGEPSGCFAVWDEAGKRTTGFVEAAQLRVAPCTPPADDELAILEGRASGPPAPPTWGDISLQAFFGGGRIGASNSLQIDQAPSLQAALDASARKRIGRFRFGPTATLRISDNVDYRGLGTGGVFAVGLPTFHPRVDPEASIEFGVQHISAIAIRRDQPGEGDVSFWSPLAALQLGVAIALSPYLEAIAAARVDGFPMRDVERDVTYCDFFRCSLPQQETWRVGGFGYGVTAGLRLLVR